MESLVDRFLFEISLIPLDPDHEQYSQALDEETYAREQLAYSRRLPSSRGHLVYNALVFYAHGEAEPIFGPAWLKQYTDARFVFFNLGSGYSGVMLNTLPATLRLLDLLTCQAHPFYQLTGRTNRIPPAPDFAERVRLWVPVWCTNDLFVRFATADDGLMEYPVGYSDYDPVASPLVGAVTPAAEASATAASSGPGTLPAVEQLAFKPAVHYASEAVSLWGTTVTSPTTAAVASASSAGSVGFSAAAESLTATEGAGAPPKKKPKTPQEKENARRVKEAAKGLKEGWRPFLDPSGNLYYGNVHTGEASWTRPA
eukprot:RCo002481